MLQLVFLLTCPLLVAAGSAWFAWHALTRPWLYALLATVALYLLYAGAFHLVGPAAVGFAVQAVEPGQARPDDGFLTFLAPYTQPLLVFLLLAVPTVLGLLRAFKR